MQSYFFDLVEDGALHVDEFGSDLVSAEDARILAQSLLADVARDAMRDGEAHDFACEVRDHRHRLLHRGVLTYRGAPAPTASDPTSHPQAPKIARAMTAADRARDLGIPFDGVTGTHNAITDVPGVSVGYVTIVEGEGALVPGTGPVRTGVTAILPRPASQVMMPVFAGTHTLNGLGEMTGCHLVSEVGLLSGPITITNTHACGIARDATIDWINREHPSALASDFSLPVAAETYDGFLNDINGGHVTAERVVAAIDAATTGPIAEGSVGGGTGMRAFGFKAGSGTASRTLAHAGETYVVGVFVQANFGARRNLTIRGVRVGPDLDEPRLIVRAPVPEKSSIIGIVATDAPLLPHQCARLARRMPLGVAWTGGLGYHTSGDIFLAFSTANAVGAHAVSGRLSEVRFIPDQDLDPFFDAVAQATEEAILNALVVNQDMYGRDGNFVPALPKDRIRERFVRTRP